MATLQQLIEQRANVWSQMLEIHARADDEKRDLTAEEREKWDRADTDISRIENDIKRLEKFDARQQQMDEVDRSGLIKMADVELVPSNDENAKKYGKVFNQYVRQGTLGLNSEDINTLQSGMFVPQNANDVRTFQNALGIGTTTAGGYTVPPGFRDELIETLKFFGGMLARGQELRTDSGQPLQWPTVDDTGNIGAILAENTAMTQQDVVFGTATLNAYMYTSKEVLVSYQLLNDSAVDVDALLRRLLATRIARIWNQHFTTGTGSSQPQGIVTGVGVGKTGLTGQTTTVIYDDLVDLITSIDPAYRTGAEEFMMNTASLAAVRKLKDTQGHPLWQPSLQVGVPSALLGYPVAINNDMASMAANAKSILFGNFNEAYVKRIVNDVQLVRLNERYAEFLQVGFFGFARCDAAVQRVGAVKAYANSAT